MSLNGLDSKTITEAYQSSLAEPAGWFLLHYVSRDTVELLSSGSGGLPEARTHAVNFCGSSPQPLFGLVQHREHKVLIKLLPESVSRLIKARATVHFTEIIEQFSHDVVANLTSTEEFIDPVFAAACSLSPLPSDTAIANDKNTDDAVDNIAGVQPNDSGPDSGSTYNVAPHQGSTIPDDCAYSSEIDHHTAPDPTLPSAGSDAPKSVALADAPKQLPDLNRPGHSSVSESILSDLTFTDLYDSIKPQAKLAPRPSIDARHRPAATSTRQVSNLPASLVRQKSHQRQSSSTDGKGGSNSSSLYSRPRSRGQDSIKSTRSARSGRSARSNLTARSGTVHSERHPTSPTIVFSSARESGTTIRAVDHPNTSGSGDIASSGSRDLYGYANQLSLHPHPVDKSSLYANIPVTPTNQTGWAISSSKMSTAKLTPEKERLMKALQQFKLQQSEEAVASGCDDLAPDEEVNPQTVVPSSGPEVISPISDTLDTDAASPCFTASLDPSSKNEVQMGQNRALHDVTGPSPPNELETEHLPLSSSSAPDEPAQASSIEAQSPSQSVFPSHVSAEGLVERSKTNSPSGETAPITEADTDYTRPNSSDSSLDKTLPREDDGARREAEASFQEPSESRREVPQGPALTPGPSDDDRSGADRLAEVDASASEALKGSEKANLNSLPHAPSIQASEPECSLRNSPSRSSDDEAINHLSQESNQSVTHPHIAPKAAVAPLYSTSGSEVSASPAVSYRSVSTPLDRQQGVHPQEHYRSFRSISSASSRPGSGHSQTGGTAQPPVFAKRTNVSSGISQRIQKLAANSSTTHAYDPKLSRPGASTGMRTGRFGQNLDVIKSQISAVTTRQKSIIDSMASPNVSTATPLGYPGDRRSRSSLSSHSFIGTAVPDSRSPSPMHPIATPYMPLSRTNSTTSTSMPPPPFIPQYGQRISNVESMASVPPATAAQAKPHASAEPAEHSIPSNSVSVTATIVRDSGWRADAAGSMNEKIALHESPLTVERKSILPNVPSEPISPAKTSEDPAPPDSRRQSTSWSSGSRAHRFSESKTSTATGQPATSAGVSTTARGQISRPMSLIERSGTPWNSGLGISSSQGSSSDNVNPAGGAFRSSSVHRGENLRPKDFGSSSLPTLSGDGSTGATRTSRTDKLRQRVSLTIGSVGLKTLGELISPSSKKAKSGFAIGSDPSGPAVGQVQSMQAMGADVIPGGTGDMRMLDDVMLGDINVQFPDSLLWKRRYVTISSIGELIFTISKPTQQNPALGPSQYSANLGTRPPSSASIGGLAATTRRYHVSAFRQPYIPDRDCEELPHSVVLDFYDGRTLLCACQNGTVQKQVLMTLNEAWRVWGANPNIGEEIRLGSMRGQQTLMSGGDW